MKEWDLDSAQRKYMYTVTIFEHEGKKTAWYVRDIGCNGEEENQNFVYFGYNAEIKDINEIKGSPIYYRVKGGLYSFGKETVAVTRKFRKNWKIGICEENYNFHAFGTLEWTLYKFNPLLPLKVDIETALKKEGPISDKFYLTKSSVFYLNKEIGLRKGSKFMVNPCFVDEIKDALVGHECSIKV